MALGAPARREAPSAADIAAALAHDVAPDRIRADDLEALAVDGLAPTVAVRPAHPDEAAAALAACNEIGASVLPRGAGSQMSQGNVPERADVILDTTALDEIVAYTPADLTLGVQAGTTLAALQARLRDDGQHLPLDPPFAGTATIGGLMATNTSGPRRVTAGSFRDLVIGTEVAGPDGDVTKSGGMVVKNVTGYDLHKAHIGALGTLGLITRINLKVAPLPANERTVVFGFDSVLESGAAVGGIVDLSIVPTAVDLVDRRLISGSDRPDAPWLLAIRLGGTEAGVAAQLTDVQGAVGANGAAPQIFEGDAQRAFWREAVAVAEPPTDGSPHVVCRISALSSQIASLLGSAADVASEFGVDWRAEAHAVSGVGRVRWTGGTSDTFADAVSALRAAARVFEAAVVVESAPPGVKRRVDVWGADPTDATTEVARSLRDAFDPARTLNPGRFLGDSP